MGLAASILIGLVTVTTWATAWSDWYSYQTAEEVRRRPGPAGRGRPDLRLARHRRGARAAGGRGGVHRLAVAGPVERGDVLPRRAPVHPRLGARQLDLPGGEPLVPQAGRRRHRRGQRPADRPADARACEEIPGTRLVWAWWLTWVVGLVSGNIVQRGVLAGSTQLGDLRTNVVLSSISAVFTTAAAVLAVILIERIDELQTQRPWVPWWATRSAAERIPTSCAVNQTVTHRPIASLPSGDGRTKRTR